MEKETVKVSIKLEKFIRIVVVLLAGVLIILALNFILKSNRGDNSSFSELNDGENEEIILPLEEGVADSGFERNVKITSSNAKIIIDSANAISGNKSLGIYFFEKSNASATVEDYLNEMDENGFYRLSFWAVADTEKNKKVEVNLSDGKSVKRLSEIVLAGGKKIKYYDFDFQADKSYPDLVFSSEDEIEGQIWIDNVLLEKLNVNSMEELNGLQTTISGNTVVKNIGWAWENSDEDSGDFFSESGRAIGQVFKPANDFLSGVVFKIQNVGQGGEGHYKVELREYNETLGVVSSDVLAGYNITDKHSLLVEEEIAEKEKQMKDAFNQREKDIKAGLIENDPTVDQYPPDYTQEKIDAEKAKKRKQKLDIEIVEMKNEYNEIKEIEIPISAKLDPEKKYWIGIDNSKVKVDNKNYWKVFYDSQAGEEINFGFISEKPGEWKEFYTLWMKTFYPVHGYEGEAKILSGATISDLGEGKLLYRYQFGISGKNDSALGFFGKKIYDMLNGQFETIDFYGNYPLLKSDDYAIYRFDTLYPAKRIIIREGVYHKNLMLEFSSDGENWREVFSDSPMENGQKINSFSIIPDAEKNVFYLRARPESENSYFVGISLEAELLKN